MGNCCEYTKTSEKSPTAPGKPNFNGINVNVNEPNKYWLNTERRDYYSSGSRQVMMDLQRIPQIRPVGDLYKDFRYENYRSVTFENFCDKYRGCTLPHDSMRVDRVKGTHCEALCPDGYWRSGEIYTVDLSSFRIKFDDGHSPMEFLHSTGDVGPLGTGARLGKQPPIASVALPTPKLSPPLPTLPTPKLPPPLITPTTLTLPPPTAPILPTLILPPPTAPMSSLETDFLKETPPPPYEQS